MSVKAFLIEQTGDANVYLRRYSSEPYHNGQTLIGVAPVTVDEKGHWHVEVERKEMPPRDDPRWPTVADDGYVFQDSDAWQVFTDRLYRRVDNGEVVTLRDAPEGAI